MRNQKFKGLQFTQLDVLFVMQMLSKAMLACVALWYLIQSVLTMCVFWSCSKSRSFYMTAKTSWNTDQIPSMFSFLSKPFLPLEGSNTKTTHKLVSELVFLFPFCKWEMNFIYSHQQYASLLSQDQHRFSFKCAWTLFLTSWFWQGYTCILFT